MYFEKSKTKMVLFFQKVVLILLLSIVTVSCTKEEDAVPIEKDPIVKEEDPIVKEENKPVVEPKNNCLLASYGISGETDNEITAIEYDNEGRPLKAIESSNSYKYETTYDYSRMAIGETKAIRISDTDSSRNYIYKFDSQNRIVEQKTIEGNYNSSIYFNYNVDGLLQSIKYGYDSVACIYDASKKNIIKMEYYESGNIDNNWHTWEFTYDNNINPLKGMILLNHTSIGVLENVFFSENNLLSITFNERLTNSISYEYNNEYKPISFLETRHMDSEVATIPTYSVVGAFGYSCE